MFKKTMIPGIFGMFFIIIALLVPSSSIQRWFFFIGAVGMTITALLEKHKLYIGLQSVIFFGTLSAFLPIDNVFKGSIPLLISFPILYFLFKNHFIHTPTHLLGAIALVSLGVGYATQSFFIFFTSGLLISIFSFLELRSGFKPAIIWLLLNIVFTMVSGLRLLPI